MSGNQIEVGNQEYAYWLSRSPSYGDVYLLSERRCAFCRFEGSTREAIVKERRHFEDGKWFTTKHKETVVKPFVNYRTMLDHMRQSHSIYETKGSDAALTVTYSGEVISDYEKVRRERQNENIMKKEQFVFGVLQQCVIVEISLTKHQNVGSGRRKGSIAMKNDKTLASALWKLNKQYDVPLAILKLLFDIPEKTIGDLLYLGLTCNRGCKDWMANSI